MEHSFPEVLSHVQRGEIWDSHHPGAGTCPNMSEEHRFSFVSLHDEKIPYVELLALMGQDPGRRLGLEGAFRDDGVAWLMEVREVRVTSRKSIYDDGIYGLTREDVEAGAKYPELPENLYVDEKHPSEFPSRWEQKVHSIAKSRCLRWDGRSQDVKWPQSGTTEHLQVRLVSSEYECQIRISIATPLGDVMGRSALQTTAKIGSLIS